MTSRFDRLQIIGSSFVDDVVRVRGNGMTHRTYERRTTGRTIDLVMECDLVVPESETTVARGDAPTCMACAVRMTTTALEKEYEEMMRCEPS